MIKRTLAALAMSLLTSPLMAATWGTGQYQYDAQGNVKAIGSDQFRYDALGRLVRGDAGPNRTQTLTYDAYGNIATMQVTGTSAISFGVDPATNRLTDTSKAVFASYDDAGRVLDELGGIGNSFTYDATDTVTHATVDGVDSVYLYLPDDDRIATVPVSGPSAGPEQWTLRDSTGSVVRRLARTGASWSWEEDYVHHQEQMLAAEVNAPVRTLHFFADHLGTPRLITANGGTKVALHTYYPFGVEVTEALQDGERLKFTGHERDASSLDYMHARYYQPAWGRFLSPDPARFVDLTKSDSWNKYSYVRNNPVNATDPTGMLYEMSIDVIAKFDAWTDQFFKGFYRPTVPMADTRFDLFNHPAHTPMLAGYNNGWETVWERFGEFMAPDSEEELAVEIFMAVFKWGKVAKPLAKPALSAVKKALAKVHVKVGKLPKGKPGKFGSPQRGDAKKGYRLDPPHNNDPASPESKWHINYWDYTKGKKGSGGIHGAIPIE